MPPEMSEELTAAPEPAETVREEETFRWFVEQAWTPLRVVGGGLRPLTVLLALFDELEYRNSPISDDRERGLFLYCQINLLWASMKIQ